MNCNTNTMIKVAAGLGLIFGAAYFMFPTAQTAIVTSAPYLLLLICPISMGVMMLMMKGAGENMCNENARASDKAGHSTSVSEATGPGKT